LREQKVSFPSRDGLMLEGLLYKGQQGRGKAILCHPHPLYGGDMYSNVVGSLQDILAEGGFSTLRFNFRGVGGSEGSYGEAAGELEDVRGAVDFIAAEMGHPVYLVGYSFGAYVGAKAVLGDERVKALVCISPPIYFYDFTFLAWDERPKLLIAGDRDFVCPLKKLEEFSLTLAHPKFVHIIPGADHFWWGFEDPLAAQVMDFLRDLWPDRGP